MSGELARAIREEIESSLEKKNETDADRWWWCLPSFHVRIHARDFSMRDERVPIPQRGKGG